MRSNVTVASTETAGAPNTAEVGRGGTGPPTKELDLIWWVVRVRERFKPGEALVLLLIPFYR